MRFVADENFPRPALEALRNAGWEVFSVAEECAGISDEEVAAFCAEGQRILLTFDKDFSELIFRRGPSAGSGIVLFRLILDCPQAVADIALALVKSQPDLNGVFFALSHGTGFESGRCGRLWSADRRYDVLKNHYMYLTPPILHAAENRQAAHGCFAAVQQQCAGI